jgi:hypothetical protein
MKKKMDGVPIVVKMVLALWLAFRCSYAVSDGYILAASYNDRTTILFTMAGGIVHVWDHSKLDNPMNGYSCYLLENGNLLRTAVVSAMGGGGTGGRMPYPTNAAPQQGVISEVDPFDQLVWTFTYSNDTVMTHHDMKVMPNGNILAISFIVKTKAQMAAAFVDTAILGNTSGGGMPGKTKTLLADKIIEIKRNAAGGEVVWEWSVFDHTVAKEVASAHPELISGSIVSGIWYGQWMHLNGIDYDSTNDLILFSSRLFSECYVIDHGTTRQEAAGHTGGRRGKGGDILYRWGKPANYGANGATTIDVLHSPTWINPQKGKPGNILFFHNNEHDSLACSQVIEIAPPYDASGVFQKTAGSAFGPVQPKWLYAPSTDFSSIHMSTALRMPSGNTIAEEAYPMDQNTDTTCSRVREIAPDYSIVSQFYLKSPKTTKFNPPKVMYYPSTYKGIVNLFAKVPPLKSLPGEQKNLHKRPFSFIFSSGRMYCSNCIGSEITLFSLEGKKVFSVRPNTNRYLVDGMAPGAYFLGVTSKGGMSGMPVVLR